VKSLFTQYIRPVLALATLTMGALLLSACGASVTEVANLPTTPPATVSHAGVVTVAMPSVSYSSLQQNCTKPGVNVLLTASPSLSGPLTLTTQPFNGLGACNLVLPNPPEALIPQACAVNVNLVGATGSPTSFQGSISYVSTPIPTCSVAGNGVGTATTQITYAAAIAAQTISATGGTQALASVGINFTGINSILGSTSGTYDVSSQLINNARCNALITYPTGLRVCRPQVSQLPVNVSFIDDDLANSPLNSLAVRVTTNGNRADVETVDFQRTGTNTFTLNQIAIERDASSVVQKSGNFEILEPAGVIAQPINLTFIYTDAMSPQGANIVRTATLNLVP
jgi:hypothetical protein